MKFIEFIKSVIRPKPEETPKSIWCVVANVAETQQYGEGGAQTRRGTSHFPPGAKVYCYPALWGDGYEQVTVIGRHRGSHRYVTMVIPSKRLTNWRAQVVYSPYIIKLMSRHWRSDSEPLARQIVAMRQQRESSSQSF
jgi:hypothetical protein